MKNIKAFATDIIKAINDQTHHTDNDFHYKLYDKACSEKERQQVLDIVIEEFPKFKEAIKNLIATLLGNVEDYFEIEEIMSQFMVDSLESPFRGVSIEDEVKDYFTSWLHNKPDSIADFFEFEKFQSIMHSYIYESMLQRCINTVETDEGFFFDDLVLEIVEKRKVYC